MIQQKNSQLQIGFKLPLKLLLKFCSQTLLILRTLFGSSVILKTKNIIRVYLDELQDVTF